MRDREWLLLRGIALVLMLALTLAAGIRFVLVGR